MGGLCKYTNVSVNFSFGLTHTCNSKFLELMPCTTCRDRCCLLIISRGSHPHLQNVSCIMAETRVDVLASVANVPAIGKKQNFIVAKMSTLFRSLTIIIDIILRHCIAYCIQGCLG